MKHPSELSEFPQTGRLAGVDFGTVRIGLSICDPDRILASPLEVHPAANWQDDGEYFRELVRLEKISGFVVGLPIHCDGGESQKSLECREFAKWLFDETEIPVRLFDERFTTADAKQRMRAGGFSDKKGKKRIDAVAALVLLESFLEASRYLGGIAGEDLDASAQGGQSLDD
ncbi:Holliday junction resolvase RuvX [Rubripirellula sp.]|jgi:putative Holliday junction resolvase|nr:Holliday junction resolvase RuvX [Rubripirellula sp.]MDA9840487.1 Holliday junction resolvase RuvX [Rubripirellula sp.]